MSEDTDSRPLNLNDPTMTGGGALDPFSAAGELLKTEQQRPRRSNGQFAPQEQAAAPDDPVGSSLDEIAEEAAPPDPIQESPPDDQDGELDTQEAEPVEATDQEIEPDEYPLIDPPVSWSADAKEQFASLPREAQEIISQRETARDTEIRRVQNEAAQIRQQAQQVAEAAEQARQQYEARLPELVAATQRQLMGEFQDIQSWEDVQRLQQEDPFRFQQFQIAQQRAQAAQQEMQAAQIQRAQQESEAFQRYASEETQRFLEMAPEYADEKKAPQLQAEARAMFSELGVSEDTLQELWAGTRNLSMRSSQAQYIISRAVKQRLAEKAIARAKTAPKKPAQKPGMTRSKGDVDRARLADLDKQLSRSGTPEDAFALLKATGRA